MDADGPRQASCLPGSVVSQKVLASDGVPPTHPSPLSFATPGFSPPSTWSFGLRGSSLARIRRALERQQAALGASYRTRATFRPLAQAGCRRGPQSACVLRHQAAIAAYTASWDGLATPRPP